MAKITIKILQAALDAAHERNLTGLIQDLTYPSLTEQIAEVVEPFIPFSKPVSWVTMAPDMLYLGSPDGSWIIVDSIEITDWEASSGSITFGKLVEQPAGGAERKLFGAFSADYAIVHGVLAVTNVHGVATSGYLQTFGNVGGSFTGNLVYEANGTVHGELTGFASGSSSGPQFTGAVGVNMVFGQDAMWHTSLSGVVTSYSFDESYTNYGATEIFEGVALSFDRGHPPNRSFLADASHFAGDDEFSITLGETLYEPLHFNMGAGNDRFSLLGGDMVSVNAGQGNDLISLASMYLSDSRVIDGGEGTDTFVFRSSRPTHMILATVIEATSEGLAVYSPLEPDYVQHLRNIERVDIDGITRAFDVDGAAGQAYRLYRAAFDREPDQGGLSFWIKSLDIGVALNQAAADFIRSDEFTQLYGSAPSDKAFLASLYQNVLHRAPDDGGYAFWLDGMAHGVTRATVLQQFSESLENQAQVNEVFVTGVAYDPNPF